MYLFILSKIINFENTLKLAKGNYASYMVSKIISELEMILLELNQHINKGAVAKQKLLQPPIYALKLLDKPEKEPICGKTAGKNQQPGPKTHLHVENYSVFLCLSRKFFEQLPSGSISLNLVVEFVDVVAIATRRLSVKTFLLPRSRNCRKP